MNVEIRAEAALFPEKEYISGIFVAVCIAVKRKKEDLKETFLTLKSILLQRVYCKCGSLII
jgi:hypothetical protein